MSQLTQLHRGVDRTNADGTPVGDCYRTALACVLDLTDPQMVPHFAQDDIDQPMIVGPDVLSGWSTFALARTWVRDQAPGLDLAVLHRIANPPDQQLSAVPPVPVIAIVPSRRIDGEAHCVVWDIVNNQCIWNPATDATVDYTPDDVIQFEAIVYRYDPDPIGLVVRWSRGIEPSIDVHLCPSPSQEWKDRTS